MGKGARGAQGLVSPLRRPPAGAGGHAGDRIQEVAGAGFRLRQPFMLGCHLIRGFHFDPERTKVFQVGRDDRQPVKAAVPAIMASDAPGL